MPWRRCKDILKLKLYILVSFILHTVYIQRIDNRYSPPTNILGCNILGYNSKTLTPNKRCKVFANNFRALWWIFFKKISIGKKKHVQIQKYVFTKLFH